MLKAMSIRNKMKKKLSWKNFLAIYLAFLLVINLVLLNFPLTAVFGYEFSAINALALSFSSGFYSISFFKLKVKDITPELKELVKNISSFLVLPLLVSIINSLFTGFCSFVDGVLFYLVITAPSIIIGSALGIISVTVISKFRILFFIVLFISVFSIALLEIYFNPQVYLYNPLFGYFPGTIYDEGLSVSFNLFLYRLLNTLFFSAILILFYNSIKTETSTGSHLRRIFLVVITASFFYFFISEPLGFSTTFSGLRDKLPVRIETGHYIIYADSKIDDNTLKFIAVNQEYFYSKLSQYLNVRKENKINTFIYSSAEQKKELFGTGNADVAKPWQNSVYVSLESWENSLEHEIAHCFAGNFGWGIFKVAADFNPALIEGFAECCDGFYDEISVHLLAAVAYQNKYRLDISGLFSDFSFFGSVSGLSYIYSGSFVRFLIEKFNIENVKRFHMTNDFEKSFDVKIEEIEKEYLLFLSSFQINGTEALANYYFGRQSIIQKVCPRYISSRLEIAWELFNKKEYTGAEKYFEDILNKTDNYSALIGLSLIYQEIDSVDSAIELLDKSAAKFNDTAYEFNLKLHIADLLVLSDQLEKAKTIYQVIVESKPGLRLELLACTRLKLLNENLIKDYLKGSDFDKYLLLQEINAEEYSYFSIPFLIELSESLRESYTMFLKNFEENITVDDRYSGYAALRLSRHMLKNLDFINARKLAALSLRFKDDHLLKDFQNENYHKAEWFFFNAEKVLNEMKISRVSPL